MATILPVGRPRPAVPTHSGRCIPEVTLSAGPEVLSHCDILPGRVCAVADACSLVQVAQLTGHPRPYRDVALAVALSATRHLQCDAGGSCEAVVAGCVNAAGASTCGSSQHVAADISPGHTSPVTPGFTYLVCSVVENLNKHSAFALLLTAHTAS